MLRQNSWSRLSASLEHQLADDFGTADGGGGGGDDEGSDSDGVET